MTYVQIQITEEFNGHFNGAYAHFPQHVQQHYPHHHHHPNRLANPHVEQVWGQKIGHHDWLYWVHLKTGHMGDHHHWTLVFEVRNGHYKILELHEGHKSW